MEHSEFVSGYNTGQVKAHVAKDASGFLYEKPGLISQKYRTQQAMIRTLFFGGVVVGAALFFFVEWYIALLVLLFGLFMSTRAQKAAAKGVLDTALADESFYRMVIDKGILRVEANS